VQSESLLVLAEPGVVPTDRMEGAALPILMPGGPIQVEGLSGWSSARGAFPQPRRSC
jgi:hypothetical protein